MITRRGPGSVTAVGAAGWVLETGLAAVALAGCSLVGSAGSSEAVGAAGPMSYRVYVANESSDLVSRVVYDPAEGVRVERDIPIGIMPADTDGPHGIIASPDGEYWYATVAHGTPDGWVAKFDADEDALVARTELGRFPATVAVTPGGEILVAANFNLHGDPVPSTLSVVYAPDLVELTRITTCVRPHGGRFDASGLRHYSTCVGSDQIVEVSLESYSVSGRFSVRPGSEGSLPLDDLGELMGGGAGGGGTASCSPTWVTPGLGDGADRYVYTSCNATNEVLEIDVDGWTVTRRFDTGAAPYNLAVTSDGAMLLVTLRGDQALQVIDLRSGDTVTRLEASQPITHGVVVSPDDRYAFVTNEAVGSARGTLDVFDLDRLQRVGSVELGFQPGGIDLWTAGSGDRGSSADGGN